MFVIWCMLSLVTVCYADQLPVISRFESNKFVESMKLPKIFPTIDPSILEDVNLTTVRFFAYSCIFNLILTNFSCNPI